jgi:hypothetical protein
LSPSRRRPGTYRPPRDRREVAVAVLCALGVLVLTVALLFVLRPRDDEPATPDLPPVTLPTDTSAPSSSAPTETVPTETVPAETQPSAPPSTPAP